MIETQDLETSTEHTSHQRPLEAAIFYATHHSWKLFPCHVAPGGACSCGKRDCGNSRGKHPLHMGWTSEATSDPQKLRKLWGGKDWNVGLATGEQSGLFVMDVDGPAGRASIAGKEIPPTVIDKSGRVDGGNRYYFRWPGRFVTNVTALMPGVDIKGDGGLVILAPSIHYSGNPYEWILSPDTTPLADAPAWLLEMLPEKTNTILPQVPRAINLIEELPRVAMALQRLKPDRANDYDGWLHVGMALSELGAAGLALWKEWSAQDPKFKEGECEYKWDTFVPGDGITLGSLFYWAEQDGGRVDVIIREPAPQLPPDVLADTLAIYDDTSAKPLPEAAYIDPAIGRGASAWLSAYTALSQQWSPRAFDDFHLACGLWLLSTVAARRVAIHLGGPRYTNLYIALVARTSLWAKSTTAKIVMHTLANCGLDFLLAPDDSTPQRFISDLVLKTPAGWKDLDSKMQDHLLGEMGFTSSRGWFYEELGMKIDAMLSPSGFMSEFRGILRAFDDCPENYRYASIGRGLDNVTRPYVAMLGNMTPADLRRATKKNDALWQDGFWARWAFVTPPAGANSSRARFPQGEREIPSEITDPIKAWHARLGIPAVEMQEFTNTNKKGEETIAYVPFAYPMKLTPVRMDHDAREAFYAYHDGLLDIVEQSVTRDFDGNYARFAEKALRIAILVASLEHDNRITLPVWALAQTITERWRHGLHELYAQANAPEPTDATEREEQAIKIISKLGEATAADVARYMRKTSSGEMVFILERLADAGALVRVASTRKGTVRYALEE